MEKSFKVGDKVLMSHNGIVNKHFQREGELVPGTVVGNMDVNYPVVDFGPAFEGFGFPERGTGLSCQNVPIHCLFPFPTELAPPPKKAPKKPVKVSPEGHPVLSDQMAKVLSLLKAKGSVTALEAAGVHRVRSLSKRVCELKDAGYKVVSKFSKDPTGQRYVRYYLQGDATPATSAAAA